MTKRLAAMISVLVLALVLLAPTALAAQTGAVETGNGNCQELANGGLPFAEPKNGQGHDRGLHRAHTRAAAVFGSLGACEA